MICRYFTVYKFCVVVQLVAAANNVPFVIVNGSQMHQWIVNQENSLTLNTSDPDGDTVTVYGWTALPTGHTLSPTQGPEWEFVWTPANMDPVELM